MKKFTRRIAMVLALCMLATVFAGAAASRTLTESGMSVTLPAGWEGYTKSELEARAEDQRLTQGERDQAARWLETLDQSEGIALAQGEGLELLVQKRKVYELTSGTAAADQTETINGVAYRVVSSSKETEGTVSHSLQYVSIQASVEYRFGFTKAGAEFTEEELRVVSGIMETVSLPWSEDGGVILKPQLPVVQPGFDDLKGHWAADYCRQAVELGLFNGTGRNTFSPDAVMTRGMLVTVLYRMSGEPAAGTASFRDVSAKAYYAKAVAWAAENGIVKGSGGLFRPDDALTREELAVILYRCSDALAGDTAALSRFEDRQQVSEWAEDALAWTVSQGLMNGVSETKLAPQATTTRAQVAAILVRYLDD